MATENISNKKRKNIDLTDDTFRSLSIMAAADGKNLKAYIESVLDNEANKLREEAVYMKLLNDPETQEKVSQEEKDDFEKWLGV